MPADFKKQLNDLIEGKAVVDAFRPDLMKRIAVDTWGLPKVAE